MSPTGIKHFFVFFFINFCTFILYQRFFSGYRYVVFDKYLINTFYLEDIQLQKTGFGGNGEEEAIDHRYFTLKKNVILIFNT